MSDIKKTVTFTESVQVTDHDGDVTFSAKQGETMDLVAPSANRWIRRKKAVAGTDLPEIKAPVDEDKPETMKKSKPITAVDADKPEDKKPAAKKSATKKKAAPKKQAD